MNLEKAMKDAQDTLVVMAEIQRRQADVQKLQAEEIESSRKRMARVEISLASLTEAQTTQGERLDKLVVAIGELIKQMPRIA